MSGGPQKRSENDSRRVPVMLPYPFPGPFDYLVPPELTVAPGDVVLVPLNRREEVGVVWDAPPDRAVPDHKLKPLIGVLDTPPMREDLRRFIDWIASYTLSPPGEVMAMALRVARPAPLPTSGWQRIAPAPVGVRMTPARERVLAVLARAEPRGTGELARAAEVGTAVIRGMEQAGL
ncbi:MAG: primosomal protein N', partial [Rhodospirillales bacterium]|nr:primosomal protein N' [Rhodospirillales bacterium]